MKRMRLAFLTFLLLVAFGVLPSWTETKDMKACDKGCKDTNKQCVKDTGDRPLCEAGYAFCLECCTGGC
jgi:hypothetical protein